MKLDFIEVVGFRGFKRLVRMEFPTGFVVITGRNGVGKSTVFDAVDFALTGSISKYDVRLAKGGGLDEHIWWIGEGAALDHYVTVGFRTSSGEKIDVTRRRDGSVDSGQLSRLAELLCSDISAHSSWPETLVSTSLIRDERISAMSLDLTEQARFAAVRAALGAADISSFEDRAKEITKASKFARDAQSQNHAKAHEELGRALSTLTEARSSANTQVDSSAAKEILRKHLSTPQAELSQLIASGKDFLAKERSTITGLRSLIAGLDRLDQERRSFESSGIDIAAARQRIVALEAQILETESDLVRAEDEYQQAKAADEHAALHLSLLDQGERLGLQDGHCPLCQLGQSESEFDAAISVARAALRDQAPLTAATGVALSQGKENLIALRKELSSVGDTVGSFEAAQKRFSEEQARLDENLQAYGMERNQSVSAVTEAFLKRQDAIAAVEQSLFALDASSSQDRVSSLEARVEQLRAHVEAEAVRLNQAERGLEISQQTEKAIKQVSNELLSEQFDTVLPLLKELYRRLRPHADWREIEIDIAGKLRASLNFTVGDGYNPQFLFSSGQRRAAGLSFLLAVHLSRPWCTLNTLMLDDPIQHIDDYRSLNLVEVLSAMRKSGRQIIVAVEDKALADVLCRRLRSSATELGWRFELGVDETGSATVYRSSVIAPFTEPVLEIAEAS